MSASEIAEMKQALAEMKQEFERYKQALQLREVERDKQAVLLLKPQMVTAIYSIARRILKKGEAEEAKSEDYIQMEDFYRKKGRKEAYVNGICGAAGITDTGAAIHMFDTNVSLRQDSEHRTDNLQTTCQELLDAGLERLFEATHPMQVKIIKLVATSTFPAYPAA